MDHCWKNNTVIGFFVYDRLHEYREEIEMLKAERDHLEKGNMDLMKRVSDLQNMRTPVSVIYINFNGRIW
jgi:hypothetical protein